MTCLDCKEEIGGRKLRCETCNKEHRRLKMLEYAAKYRKNNRAKVRRASLNWYNNNKDHAQEKNREWRDRRDKEEFNAYMRDYKLRNRDRIRQINQTYYAKNREQIIAKILESDARRAASAGTYTQEQLRQRFAFWGNRCVGCGAEDNLTIDHTIPLSCGGTNWPANIRPLCRRCNGSKWKRPWRNYVMPGWAK